MMYHLLVVLLWTGFSSVQGDMIKDPVSFGETVARHIFYSDIITNAHVYTYDQGTDATYIRDGGDDMYDRGNKVSLGIDGSETETEVTYGRLYNVTGNSTFVTHAIHPFLALLWIGNEHGSHDNFYVRVEGNLGADGSGTLYDETVNQTIHHGDIELTYSVVQAVNNFDAVICEVYFMYRNTSEAVDTTPTLFLDTSRSDLNEFNNIATVSNFPKNTMFGYTLLSRTDGGEKIPDEEIAHVMSEFALLALGHIPELPALNELIYFYDEENIYNLIPGRFEYEYDGDEFSIAGRAGDMFDTGNIVAFRAGEVFVERAEYNIEYSGPGYIFYSSMIHPFTAVFQISNENRTTDSYFIRVTGDLGADGSGELKKFNGSLTVGEFFVQYATMQSFDAGSDSSVVELYYVIGSEAKWGSVHPTNFTLETAIEDRRRFNNTIIIKGAPKYILLSYMLLSKESASGDASNDIPAEEIETFLRDGVMQIISDHFLEGRFFPVISDETVNTTLVTTGTPEGPSTPEPSPDTTLPTPEPNATETEWFLYRICNGIEFMSDLISGGYNYRYDGNEEIDYYDYYGSGDYPELGTGYGDRNIYDGGRDMYDVGNKVSFFTSMDSNEMHMTYGRHYLRDNYDVLSKPRHPFITMMWIGNENRTIDSFNIRVIGDTGADGRGKAGTFSGSFSASAFDVSFHVVEVYDAYDPTICELYFTVSNVEEWGSHLDDMSLLLNIGGNPTNELNNTATVAGYPSNVALFYVLLSRESGEVISPNEVIDVISRMVSAIAEREVVFPYLDIEVEIVEEKIHAFVGARVRLCANTRYDDHRFTSCERGQVATLSSLERSVSTELGYDVIVEAEIMECVELDMCNATCEHHLADTAINCTLMTCCNYDYCNYPHYWYYWYWERNMTFNTYMVPEEALPTIPVQVLPNCYFSDIAPNILSCLRPFQNSWPFRGEEPSVCSTTLEDSLRCIARVLEPCHTDDIFNLALTRLPIQNVTAFTESLIEDGFLSTLMCSSGEVDFVEAFLGDMSFFEWMMYSVPRRMYPLFGECDILMSHSLLDWTTDLINTVRNGENRTQLCKSTKRFLYNVLDGSANRCNFTALLDYLPCDSVLRNQLRALHVQAPERFMDIIPDFCAGIEPDPIIEEVTDAEFLPSCTFRQAVQSVWTCEGIFTESAPYSIPDACKTNVNRLLQCVANRLEYCAKGEGFNVFSLMENGEEHFKVMIQAIRSLAIGETSWWYFDVRDIFCTNSHIYYFHEWDETFGVMRAICDARTWPDLMDQVQDLYFKYAGARNPADLCLAFRGIRDWIANTTRDRCHNIDLIKYLYPSEREFGEMVVKYAKVLEHMLPEASISICPDPTDMMPPKPGMFDGTTWLRSYVKWRIDTLPRWRTAFEKWTDEMGMDTADLPEAPSCLDLTRLKCKSSMLTCADDRGCRVCYCPDDDYVDLGDYAFEPWLMDFDNWQNFFDSYKAAFDAWEKTT